jgi:hypothetical protein
MEAAEALRVFCLQKQQQGQQAPRESAWGVSTP